MPSRNYARRYAQTFFGIARESNDLVTWQSGLRKLAGIVRDEALSSMLEDQSVSNEAKTATLTERLGEPDPLAVKLVLMLAAKGRLATVEDIADEYQRLMDGYHGIEGTEIAEITTAIPLDNDYKLQLAKKITAIAGRPVALKAKVDPELVGGIVIRLGDKLIDGSIRSKLDALRRNLGSSSGV